MHQGREAAATVADGCLYCRCEAQLQLLLLVLLLLVKLLEILPMGGTSLASSSTDLWHHLIPQPVILAPDSRPFAHLHFILSSPCPLHRSLLRQLRFLLRTLDVGILLRILRTPQNSSKDWMEKVKQAQVRFDPFPTRLQGTAFLPVLSPALPLPQPPAAAKDLKRVP